jgi:hypothetical protein
MSWAVAMTARARPSRRGGCPVVAAVAAPLAVTAIPGVVPVSDEVADKIIPFVRISGVVIQRRDDVGPACW